MKTKTKIISAIVAVAAGGVSLLIIPSDEEPPPIYAGHDVQLIPTPNIRVEQWWVEDSTNLQTWQYYCPLTNTTITIHADQPQRFFRLNGITATN